MKSEIIMFLWNYCDFHVGHNQKRFKFSAYLLHLFGCDYWINSKDFNEVQS